MAKAQTKTGNPFLDGDFGDLMDFSKFTTPFKLPNLDSTALVETQRRNIEAVTQANRVAFEGLQAVSQRQVEILRRAMDEATKAVREIAAPGQPAEKLAVQTEMLKDAYETVLANVRELTEITTKSNTEAADLLSHRFADSLDELKGVIKATNGAAK